MPLVDNKGYSNLQKNNSPAEPMVMVRLIATAMVTAMATAIAFNGSGVFLESSLYFCSGP
jgi:hypothetical protein